jgi:hypothetical protein
LQFFDTDNQKQETDEDNEQVVQSDNNAIQSTEDSDDGNNLGDIEKGNQERDTEDVIAKEIPFVQSYTRDIQSTFE